MTRTFIGTVRSYTQPGVWRLHRHDAVTQVIYSLMLSLNINMQKSVVMPLMISLKAAV